MAVGFTVKYYWYQIGTSDFLYSFFSTIAYNLESGKWGEKYPIIMNELYNGKVANNHIDAAMREVELILNELKIFSCDRVVWDIEDLSKQPPWGKNISPEITNLSNYFVTSDGEDLIILLMNALRKAKDLNCDINITNM